ncbi:MAG: hypothetical protein ACI8Y4_001694 [Candidatus Poriferisodalaceae bacterium]|jgi:hypothetical protein
MMLARDGHDVVTLERDPLPQELERELPEIVTTLRNAGALEVSPMDGIPTSVTGGQRDGDERSRFISGRRPVVEAVVAHALGESDVSAHVPPSRTTKIRDSSTTAAPCDPKMAPYPRESAAVCSTTSQSRLSLCQPTTEHGSAESSHQAETLQSDACGTQKSSKQCGARTRSSPTGSTASQSANPR